MPPWSRRNSTRCSISNRRSASNSRSSLTASASLTPVSSAPRAQVRGSTRISDFMSDHENGRAGGPARLEVAMGLHRVLQGVALVDFDADASGGDVVEQLGGQRGLLGRIGDVIGQ